MIEGHHGECMGGDDTSCVCGKVQRDNAPRVHWPSFSFGLSVGIFLIGTLFQIVARQ